MKRSGPSRGIRCGSLVPGWEGATHVKWLQRIVVADQPYQSRDETSKYTDLMPDGKARQFTFPMEAKSVITYPSGGQTLPGPGLYELTGLAWSGRGRVERVDVTTDGGRSWQEARLQEPRLRLAFVRFRLRVAVGRTRGDDRVAMRRRDRLRAADARVADCGAGERTPDFTTTGSSCGKSPRTEA